MGGLLSKITKRTSSVRRTASTRIGHPSPPVRSQPSVAIRSSRKLSRHPTLSTLRISPCAPRPSASLSSPTSGASTFHTAQSELLTPLSTGSNGSRSPRMSAGSLHSTTSTRTVGTTTKRGISSRVAGIESGGASGVSAVSTRTPVQHPDKGDALICPAFMTRRVRSVGCTVPVAQEKSPSRNAKNGCQTFSSIPSPCAGCVELRKERRPGTDNDERNTHSFSPVELPDGNDDTVTSLDTLYRASKMPKQGLEFAITPPRFKRNQIDDTFAECKITAAITTSSRTPEAKSSPQLTLTESTLTSAVPPGVTLNIGIPCVISSKGKRFRASVRYIGEVLGECGPWVGVEVPIDTWVGDVSDGRAWCDGSCGGIRYFDIGGDGSVWVLSAEEDIHVLRRRSGLRSNGRPVLKGLGDTKTEVGQFRVGLDRWKRMRSASTAANDMSGSRSMGLFVRPQQVLYVVDAPDF